MKNSTQIFLLILIILFNVKNNSQTIDTLYDVATWQGFCSAAVTFTFDDNTSNQYTVALPMFDEFDFKTTFYPVINWSPDWSAFQNAASNGHEIGSHTVSHPHLGSLTLEEQINELSNSKNQINSHITGNQCLTIAYPYCEVGNDSLNEIYYLAGRTCAGSIVPRTPSDFMQISSIICGSQGSVQTSQDFNNKVNSAVSSKGWVVYLLHGIDNDGGYSPVTNTNLRGALAYLDTNRTNFWVSTFSNVARYIRERNSVSVDELSFEDTVITLTAEDTLDNSIYNVPVTLRRLLPGDWSSAIVLQGEDTLISNIVEVESVNYIMFDIVPDMGEIQILKRNVTDVSDNNESHLTTPYLMQNYPNPFNPETKIGFKIPSFSHVTLKVYDTLGNEISTLINEDKPSGFYEVNYNAGNLSSGIYFYQLKTNSGFVWTRKLALLK